MELCQRIFWCLAFLIFWQSFKSIGSIEQSSEPQKIPDLCFAQNLIEAYNMSVVIYVSQLLVWSENVYQVTCFQYKS